MQKKFLMSISLLSVILAFSFSYSFANTNIMNTVGSDIKDVASDAGNVISDGANVVRDVVGQAENGVENVASDVFGGANANRSNTTMMGGTNDNDYDATRTSTRAVAADTDTFLGMTANAWTWLIMAVLGVAIVALIWFYSKQHSDSYTNNSQE